MFDLKGRPRKNFNLKSLKSSLHILEPGLRIRVSFTPFCIRIRPPKKKTESGSDPRKNPDPDPTIIS